MRNLVWSLVAISAAGAFLNLTAHPLPANEFKMSSIEARLVATAEGTMVEVLTREKLANPQLQHHTGEWVPFHAPKKQGEKYLYRAKSYYTVTEDEILSLKCDAPKQKTVLHTSLVVAKLPTDNKATVALTVGNTEQVGKDAAPAVAARKGKVADLGLAIINRFRAARGLAPIEYDEDYAAVSRKNNEMGGVHRYNTGWQTWASPSDAESAVSMWMGSYYNSHGVIIMNPNITRGGTHSHPVYGTTFTGG